MHSWHIKHKKQLHLLVHMIRNVQTQMELSNVCVVIRFHRQFASHTDVSDTYSFFFCPLYFTQPQLRCVQIYLFYSRHIARGVFRLQRRIFSVQMWASFVLLLLNPRKLLGRKKGVKGQENTALKLCNATVQCCAVVTVWKSLAWFMPPYTVMWKEIKKIEFDWRI